MRNSFDGTINAILPAHDDERQSPNGSSNSTCSLPFLDGFRLGIISILGWIRPTISIVGNDNDNGKEDVPEAILEPSDQVAGPCRPKVALGDSISSQGSPTGANPTSNQRTILKDTTNDNPKEQWIESNPATANGDSNPKSIPTIHSDVPCNDENEKENHNSDSGLDSNPDQPSDIVPKQRTKKMKKRKAVRLLGTRHSFDEIIQQLQSNLGNCFVHLDLHEQKLSPDQIQQLVTCFQQQAFVQYLNLHLNAITDALGGIQIIRSLAAPVHLQKLDLSGNRLSDDAVLELSNGLLGNPKNSLTQLFLYGNRITRVGGMALAKAIQSNHTLTTLHLGSNPVSDQTVIHLANGLLSYEHRAIKNLILNYTQTSDIGVSALAIALKSSKGTLVELSLSFNRISNKGAKELAQALEHNNTLKAIYLSNNQISDVGAIALANAISNNATLLRLGINDNPISKEGKTQLAAIQTGNEILKIHLHCNPNASSVSKSTGQTSHPQSYYTDDPFAYLYGLSNVKQDRKKAFEYYLKENAKGSAAAADNLGWMYRSGCGTDVSIDKAKQCLEKDIAKHHLPNSMFNLADILASSTMTSDLQKARDLISRIDKGSDIFQRGQWLLPFIERQSELLEDMEDWPIDGLRPDFIHDADLQIVAYIVRGQFGKVYLGRLRGERWVAVKFLSVDLIETEEKDQTTLLLCERFTWRMLDAFRLPNVAKYIGFVDDLGNDQRGLIFELCADISKVENEALKIIEEFTSVRFMADLNNIPDWSCHVRSSLRSTVVLAPRRLFTVSKMIEILQMVAEALTSLHKNGFVHRDIADRNVLCDGSGNVQLTDMGLAKFVGGWSGWDGNDYDPIAKYQCYLTPGHHYALAWHAPECISQRTDKQVKKFKAVFSTSSDVYSFGMLMWQCFAHGDPFDEDRFRPDNYNDPRSIETTAQALMSAILNGERPDLDIIDQDTPDRLIDLISNCWETDPDARPTMDQIIVELGEIKTLCQCARPTEIVKRRAKQCKAKWFDVETLYWPIPTKKQARLDSGSYSHRLEQYHLFPPSLDLASRMNELIVRANALANGEGNQEEQSNLLHKMQGLERGLMTWMSNLAVKEMKGDYQLDDDEIWWIQNIASYYHAIVPLLRRVLLQKQLSGDLPSQQKAFISHTGCDKQSYASPVANYLMKNGVENVFIDKRLPIGSKGEDEMMWAAVSCRYFWCVLSQEFITRWYPMRELMIAYVRHMQEPNQDFTLVLDCLEAGRNPNGMWMETILKLQSLKLYQADGTEHAFPAGMQKGRDESFDKRIARITKELCL